VLPPHRRYEDAPRNFGVATRFKDLAPIFLEPRASHSERKRCRNELRDFSEACRLLSPNIRLILACRGRTRRVFGLFVFPCSVMIPKLRSYEVQGVDADV
jgi:hypothetical protein